MIVCFVISHAIRSCKFFWEVFDSYQFVSSPLLIMKKALCAFFSLITCGCLLLFKNDSSAFLKWILYIRYLFI
jgi:hypothetical protein